MSKDVTTFTIKTLQRKLEMEKAMNDSLHEKLNRERKENLVLFVVAGLLFACCIALLVKVRG